VLRWIKERKILLVLSSLLISLRIALGVREDDCAQAHAGTTLAKGRLRSCSVRTTRLNGGYGSLARDQVGMSKSL
jgi:hypothetical protein